MARRGSKPEDLTGQRFGRLVALEYAGHDNQKRSQWLCRCDCGNQRIAAARRLKCGEAASCGCLHRETGMLNIQKAQAANRGYKHRIGGAYIHGHSANHHSRDGRGSRAYNSWRCMRRRCDNPKNHKYPQYGGRGIRVCERWDSFQHFLEDMGEPPEGHTLSRKDHDGHYEPANCEWAPRGQH